VRCRWVTCDEAFGRDSALLDQVASSGLWSCAEVPQDTWVWRLRPATASPRGAGRGRTPPRARLCPGHAEAEEGTAVAAGLSSAQWSRQLIKEGSKGPLVADFAVSRVVAVRAGVPGPEVWLVLRGNLATGEWKTSVCNAPVDPALKTLVRLSGRRWPMEPCVEEGKQYLGLGYYAVRSWRGWHHHMTLCLLAHFFLVRQQPR
jgi:hypothetical protein